MRTEIYIENNKLDLSQEIATQFTYAIDDVMDFAARNTSYSKTITIAGSPNNNKIFGNVFELNNANPYNKASPNVGLNFNASQSAQCRIFIDNIQIFKGVLRVLEIKQTERQIMYECSVFGDLGGFVSALGNKKLSGNTNTEDNLDFSAYNQNWTYANITDSWDNINGSGVLFPLIDYGNVTPDTLQKKIDFDFKAFRPAFYVKEILEKIIDNSGYTADFPFLDTALMQRLVIPNNQRVVTKATNNIFTSTFTATTTANQYLPLTITFAGSFTGTNPLSYTGLNNSVINITCRPVVRIVTPVPSIATIDLYIGSTIIVSRTVFNTGSQQYTLNFDASNVVINNGQQVSIRMSTNITSYQLYGGVFNMVNTVSTEVPIIFDELLEMNQLIPRGIFQKDFFISICKMFNLYVYDDAIDDKKLIIKPFNQFYSGEILDWSNKVDRDSAWSIKPMSEINARYYQFKYKPDNDYYAENYRKKFNEGYGDFIYDTEFDFVKDTDSTEVIFAGTILYNLSGTDKIYSSIYKLSSSNTTEDNMDSVIRILQAKKIPDVASYAILNNFISVGTQTVYGYAGHLDDPFTPTNDINFGAPQEIYFTATTYPSTNLFNANYSDYMSEITSKDSKLLSCQVLLDSYDIQSLDFSKYIFIDNVLYRLNKVDNYNPIDYKTSKVELLKVIDKID
jgi:hypothetical protein